MTTLDDRLASFLPADADDMSTDELPDVPDPLPPLTAEDAMDDYIKARAASYLADEKAKVMAKTWAKQDGSQGEEWPEEDMDALFDGGLDILEPDVFQRTDGGFMFYTGLPNCIFGDASAGKTALMQYAAYQEIRDGRHVYLVDYETNPKVWAIRLSALGLTRQDITTRFHYLKVHEGQRPPANFHPSARLAIIDSLTAAVEAGGHEANDAQGIEAVYRQAVHPFTQAGLAAVIIDHVGHADKARPMNSIRKIGIVQGAMYHVEVVPTAKFGVGRQGQSLIRLFKDNMGGTKTAKGEVLARFTLSSPPGGVPVTCSLDSADLTTLAIAHAVAQDTDARKAGEIYEFLARGDAATRSAIRNAVGGHLDTIGRALALLIDQGHVKIIDPTAKFPRYHLANLPPMEDV